MYLLHSLQHTNKELDFETPFLPFLKRLMLLFCVQGCKSEAPRQVKEAQIPEDWPKSGAITFRGYKMSYRENTPVVLNGLDFIIRPGEKLGIVGRTGSGEGLTSGVVSTNQLTDFLFPVVSDAVKSLKQCQILPVRSSSVNPLYALRLQGSPP